MANALTILLVDDNYEFAKRMSGVLKELPVVEEVKVAVSYEEAEKVISAQMPDFALLDIHLPGKNGIELLKLIKKSKSACCVIMVTNQADEFYRTVCKILGAEYFFDKTNDFPAIPALIFEMAGERARR
jgi:response regulator of citrate/malate metabolism